MNIVKRRAAGGRLLHFLSGITGNHARVALCGHDPQGTSVIGIRRAGWRFPGYSRDNMDPHAEDCPHCVDAFIKAGGQFS